MRSTIQLYFCNPNVFICLNHCTHKNPGSSDSHATLLELVLVTEKAVAPHSSTLAWRIPWREEPGRLQSMGSQRVGHD